jgi:hypothetical protein
MSISHGYSYVDMNKYDQYLIVVGCYGLVLGYVICVLFSGDIRGV